MHRRILRSMSLAILFAALSLPALAQQKTVKQCNEEWTANKVAIQASGKTKKQFVAECRGLAPSAGAPASPAPPPGATAPAPPGGVKKTVRQCNEEWTANKAAIQASGKTKKEFIAECRGTAGPAQAAPAAPPPSPTVAAPERAPGSPPPPSSKPGRAPIPGAPRGPNQFATETEARSHCPGDTVVWANLQSKIYHFSTSRSYGTTKNGAYMCEADTATAGIRAAKNEKHP